MSGSATHREMVKKLLDSKAVDFAAIGKVLAEVGPSLAAADDFEGDGFCGTNRFFIRVFRIFSPGTPVENLGELKAIASDLQS
jgi:hypothetical protein